MDTGNEFDLYLGGRQTTHFLRGIEYGINADGVVTQQEMDELDRARSTISARVQANREFDREYFRPVFLEEVTGGILFTMGLLYLLAIRPARRMKREAKNSHLIDSPEPVVLYCL